LQTCNPNVNATFWDWSLDSQAPEKSIIFDYFGHNGQNEEEPCVIDGPFANWQAYFPEPHCVKRYFGGSSGPNATVPALYSPEEMYLIIEESRTFDEFRGWFEYTAHNMVHDFVGGRKGEMTGFHSTNDPIFFVHHSNIDRYWYLWQKRNGFTHLWEDYAYRDYEGNKVSPDDVLDINTLSSVFLSGQTVRVKDTLNTLAGGDWCYTYTNGVVPEIVEGLDIDGSSGLIYDDAHPDGYRDPSHQYSNAFDVQPGTTPGPRDRTNDFKLRYHEKIPESGDLFTYYFEVSNKFIDFMNSIPGYVSAAALIYTQPEAHRRHYSLKEGDGRELVWRSATDEDVKAQEIAMGQICGMFRRYLKTHPLQPLDDDDYGHEGADQQKPPSPAYEAPYYSSTAANAGHDQGEEYVGDQIHRLEGDYPLYELQMQEAYTGVKKSDEEDRLWDRFLDERRDREGGDDYGSGEEDGPYYEDEGPYQGGREGGPVPPQQPVGPYGGGFRRWRSLRPSYAGFSRQRGWRK
ncbi:hypothetical protein HK102_009277, partial [Quaeritorhiza haematococci]